jgi:hypothetical protein
VHEIHGFAEEEITSAPDGTRETCCGVEPPGRNTARKSIKFFPNVRLVTVALFNRR